MLSKEEIKYLACNISISNHPICWQPLQIKRKYVDGITEILMTAFPEEPFVKCIIEQWAISILGEEVKYEVYLKPKSAKKALALNRVGWKLFRNSYLLFFDCYYLSELISAISHDKIHEIIKKNASSLFSYGAEKAVYNYFCSGIIPKGIPQQLISHRLDNLKFQNKGINKILVVANVTAGKSSLINAIVGFPVCKTGNVECTEGVACIVNKQKEEGATIEISKQPSVTYSFAQNISSNNIFEGIGVHFKSFEAPICLCDTPGTNVSDSKTIVYDTIHKGDYNLLIYVSNSQYFGTNDESALINFISQHCHTPKLFVLNKLDRFKQKEDSIQKMINDYRKNLLSANIQNPKIIPVSSKAALLFQLNTLPLDEEDAFDREMLDIKFSKDYYDLPAYVTGNKHNNLLDRTGITMLINEIKKTLKI